MSAIWRRDRAAVSVPELVMALIVAALLSVTGAAGAGAAPLSQCSAHHGTIVAVDFAHWGGPIVRGCGVGAATGYALLHAAGFTTAGDQHDGPGFVCRLGSRAFHGGGAYPTTTQQRCLGTPSATAYWSYWLAPPAGGGTWTYSPLGAGTEQPRPGEVQLWTFGASGSGAPSMAPSALRAGSSVTHIGAVAVTAAVPARLAGSAGSALPLVIGVCLVVALCAGAAWALWRRRAYE